MTVLLSACGLSMHDAELASEYVALAEPVFMEYLQTTYPDIEYDITEIKSLSRMSGKLEDFKFVAVPDPMVKMTVKFGLFDELELFCNTSDLNKTIYTNEYYYDVISSVNQYMVDHMSNTGHCDRVDARLEGIQTGLIEAPQNLLPIHIRNAEDLFKCDIENFYSLKLELFVPNNAMFEIDYEYLFSAIPNSWKNDIQCKVTDKDEYAEVIQDRESQSYSVNFHGKNDTISIGGIDIRYNNHFYFVSAKQTIEKKTYASMWDEEKEYLQSQWRSGHVKMWYGYDITIIPTQEKSFYTNPIVVKTTSKGRRITYNYRELMILEYDLTKGDALGKYRLSNIIGQYHGGSFMNQTISVDKYLRNGITYVFHLDVYKKDKITQNSTYISIPRDCEKYYKSNER
jgi:hypothetical protein